MSAALTIDDLHLGYSLSTGYQPVVQGFSLHLPAGQTACLLGASGCGKTTVLRAIAGFELVCAGRILLGQRELSSPQTHLPPEQRRVGMVFQDYALFPHLTAAQNIAFGLQKRTRDARASEVAALLDLVGLADKGQHYPHQLSGGQQQRIALARALAPKPELLLLDEPFSNLDADTTERLMPEVRNVLRQTGQTALLVTHTLREAQFLAEKIVTMQDASQAHV